MQEIILDISQEYLTTGMFNAGAAIYVVKRNYKIASQVVLPKGSELKILEGNITLASAGNKKQPNGIFLLCPDQSVLTDSSYKYFCITSKSEPEDPVSEMGKSTLSYTPSSSVFLQEGDVVKYAKTDIFNLHLTSDCRIMLPLSDSRIILNITSTKVGTIQIDGKSNVQINAENCKFERIFASPNGMVLANRDVGYTDNSRFDNCEISALNFGAGLTPPDSCFLSIWASVPTTEPGSPETINRLILHDCIVKNIGLTGTVVVDNCTFLFGPNVNNNFETLHCSNHSRITNSLFDGRENEPGAPALTADVIDLFNGHDIIIDGCTFIAYKGAGEAGCNMITVKSHYYSGTADENNKDQISNFIGPQNGVIIRNCFFDLPTFTGSAIEVWNGPIDLGIQNRSFNRQFTLIEGNYMEMPKAVSFVNCFRFSDYVTVRNNVGCVNNRLVLVNQYVPDPSNPNLTGSARPKNKVHNLVIEGNILRYQKYQPEDVPNKMLILTGTYIENLVLANNTVEGSLWSMWPSDITGNLSGTVRVLNNESIGNVLFRARSTENAVMPNNVITFFSGNISNGKKTDIGDNTMQASQGDGLLFEGRKFFNTGSKIQLIYINGSWYHCNYSL